MGALGSIFGAPRAPEIPPPLKPESPEDIIRRSLSRNANKPRADLNSLIISPLSGLGLTTTGTASNTTAGTYVPPS